MPYDPVTRAETGGANITQAQHDTNWTGAATAINHGGYYTLAKTGAVERTTQVRLAEMVSLKDFGATGNGSTDDYAAIDSAIDSGEAIFVPPGTYRHAQPIQMRDGLFMMGCGPRISTFKRTGNIVGWQGIGTGVDDLLIRDCHIRQMSLHGDDQASDVMQLKYFANSSFEHVEFFGSTGRALHLDHAAQDFRMFNCVWEWCGSSDGTLPVIESAGTTVLPPNQIHFMGCRWETNRTQAFKTTVNNTNEIFFHSCKMEHINGLSGTPLVSMTGAAQIYFGPLQLAWAGTAGTDLNGLVELTDCTSLHGSITGEVIGNTLRRVKNVVWLAGTPRAVDLSVTVVGDGAWISDIWGIDCELREVSVNARAGWNYPAGARNGISPSSQLVMGARHTRLPITALPSYGLYEVGDTIHRSAPAASTSTGWVCTTAGGLGAAWASSQTYALGQWVTNGGRVYLLVAKTSGTTANAPVHTSGDATGADTYTWRHRSAAVAVFKTLPALGA